MNILKYILFLGAGIIVMLLIGSTVYTVYGAWSLILNPILGFCLGWTAMDIADKIK